MELLHDVAVKSIFRDWLFEMPLHWDLKWDCGYLLFTQASQGKRKVIFKRAESYIKEYLAREKEEIRLKRVARASGDFYVPAQPKVYFVIRIRG